MFFPATAEISAYLLPGTLILKLPVLDAAVLGCVMAAVSPAVVVPRMLKLKETGYGADKGIPDMIMTGASADDVFVIVLFTSLTTMATGGTFSRRSGKAKLEKCINKKTPFTHSAHSVFFYLTRYKLCA